MEMSDTAENESRWVVFSEELFAALLEIEGDDGRWGMFCKHSTLQFAEDNLRSMILQEFLFQAVDFCLKRAVSYVQAAAAVTSSQITFDHCVFRGGRASVQDTRSRFEAEFSKRIRQHPMGTFDVKFVEGFSSFFATTVMRNLAAYQYAFRNMQETVEKDILLQVQTPLVPEPLSSALNSDQVEVDEEFANPDGTFIEA